MTYPIIKEVGTNWTWIEDYIFAYATYTVNCPEDRTCQVGMGVFAFGEPRGEKVKFSGVKKIVTIGAGALHVRAIDNKGPCTVRIDQGDVGLVPIIPKDTSF